MLLAPCPDLPDYTEIYDVQLPIIIGVVLKKASIQTVGEIRKTPDANQSRYPAGPCCLPSEDRWADVIRRLVVL